MIKVQSILSNIMLAILIICTAYVLFLSSYPFKPVTLDKPITTDKTTYHSGDTVTLTMYFTKNMDIKPEVTYYLVNHTIITLRSGVAKQPLGKRMITRSFILPNNLEEGTYQIQIDLSYKISFIRTIDMSWVSNTFKVENKRNINQRVLSK